MKPDLPHAKFPIDLELVDAAVTPNDLDSQVATHRVFDVAKHMALRRGTGRSPRISSRR